MDPGEEAGLLASLRERALQYEEAVRTAETARLDAWRAERPEIKAYIAGLAESRAVLRRELARVEAAVSGREAAAAAAAVAVGPGGVTPGFNVIRSQPPPGRPPLDDAALAAERDRLVAAVTRLEAELAAARADADARLAAAAVATATGGPPPPDPCGEAEVWATRLVVLQDTLRMHREEAGAVEVELAGRARLAAAAAERAAAEAAGTAAAARLRAQLDATEARLDRLKMELYFPRAKGYSFAVGSKGIYFGGKDLIVSECSGPVSFECSTTAPGAGGGGGGGGGGAAPSSTGAAVMEMRIGAWAADEAGRWAAEADAAAAGGTAGGSGGGAPANGGASARPRPAAPPPGSPSVPRPRSAGSLTGAAGAGAAPADRPRSAGGQGPAVPPLAKTPPAPSPLRPPPPPASPAPPSRESSPDSDGLLEAAAGGADGGGGARPATPTPPPLPPLPPSAAADRVSAPPGAGRGRALAARFLSKIGSDRQMERYARRAAQPGGPEEAWPEDGSVGGGGAGAGARQGVPGSGDALPPLPPSASRGAKPSLAQRLMRRAASRKEGRAAAAAAAYASAAGLGGSTTTSTAPASSPRPGRYGGLSGMRRALSGTSLASAGDSPDGRAPVGSGPPPQQLQHQQPPPPLSDAQADVDAAAGGDADLGDLPPAASMLDLAGAGGSGGGGGAGPAAGGAGPPPLPGRAPSLGPSEEEEEEEDGADGGGSGSAAGRPSHDWGHLGAGPVDAAGIATESPPGPRSARPRPPPRPPASAAGGGSSADGRPPHHHDHHHHHPPGRAPARRGLLVVLRVSDVALVGERGSKCPSLSVAELTVEFELHGRLGARYDGRTGSWEPHGRCAIEVGRVSRAVRGASVPVPKALLRLIVSAVLPPVFQRLLTGALPPELGEYAADAGRAGMGVRLGGDVSIVGPALSALDARLATPPPGSSPPPGEPPPRDAAAAARAASAAAEARAALGLTPGQAALVDALFSAPATALTGDPRPASLAVLATLHKRYARHPALWQGACAVWDTALRALAAARRVPPPPAPFADLASGAASGLARKPVRILLTLTHADVGACVDSAVSSLRAYFERQARDLAVQGGGQGAAGGSRDAPPPPSLGAALSALEAWHAYVQSQLRSFKATFRGAAARVVASADARGASVGAEAARYVGPLRIRVPIAVPSSATAAAAGGAASGGGALAAATAADPDAFSFTVPLPDPSSATVRRFVEAARSAVASPPSRPRGVAPGVTRPLPPGDAAFTDPALGWFVEGDPAAAAGPGAPGVPASLGTLAVDGLRARVRLDEAALAELLGVGGPSGGGGPTRADPAHAVRLAQTAAGVLAALGDVARVSFSPAAGPPSSASPGATPDPGFVLAIESAAASALHADVAGLAFSTADGVTPARLTRLGHALARAALLALAGGDAAAAGEAVAAMDARFDTAAEHLGRDALELALCVDAVAGVARPPGAGPGVHGPLTLRVTGVPSPHAGEDGAGGACDLPPPPLVAGNDVDLSTLFAGVRAPPAVPGADV